MTAAAGMVWMGDLPATPGSNQLNRREDRLKAAPLNRLKGKFGP